MRPLPQKENLYSYQMTCHLLHLKSKQVLIFQITPNYFIINWLRSYMNEGEQLGIKPPKRAFLGNGSEVTSVADIQKNANVYFSAGENFYQVPRGNSSRTEKLHISVLGAGGVGKSAITLRFVRDFFIKNWFVLHLPPLWSCV